MLHDNIKYTATIATNTYKPWISSECGEKQFGMGYKIVIILINIKVE